MPIVYSLEIAFVFLRRYEYNVTRPFRFIENAKSIIRKCHYVSD